MYNNNDNNDIIFFKVWRNLVINRIIFNFSRLYIKNKQVEFNDLGSLRLYGEREFITKLVINEKYKSIRVRYTKGIKYTETTELLIKGDLPEYGVLKELDLSNFKKPITSFDVIPNGVEIIKFSKEHILQVSNLPNSVNTLSNIVLKEPYSNNQIPSNITSLSFYSINSKQFYDIKLPLSIVKLDLHCLKSCIHYQSPIAIGTSSSTFIPPSVKELTITYDEQHKSKLPIVPSSVTKLHLYLGNFTINCIDELIPIGIKDLTITSDKVIDFNIFKEFSPCSLTKLDINYIGYSKNDINSVPIDLLIPSTVLDLKIVFSQYPQSFDGLFPLGLTKLHISSIYKVLQPPISKLKLNLSTIKHLRIGKNEIDLSNYQSK